MSSHPHRVLVIDDNPDIHGDFRKVLCTERTVSSRLSEAETLLFGETRERDRQYDFEVDSAYQGQEGLARVYHALQEGRPYEIAFVDVRMPPGWDGVEVTPRLWIADPELHIVICTAYSDYTWEEMFAKIGVTDRMAILKKPFDRDEVLQVAHSLVARRGMLRSHKPKKSSIPSAALAETEEKFQTEVHRLKPQAGDE